MAAFSFLALYAALTDSQMGTVKCLGGGLFKVGANSKIHGSDISLSDFTKGNELTSHNKNYQT